MRERNESFKLNNTAAHFGKKKLQLSGQHKKVKQER